MCVFQRFSIGIHSKSAITHHGLCTRFISVAVLPNTAYTTLQYCSTVLYSIETGPQSIEIKPSVYNHGVHQCCLSLNEHMAPPLALSLAAPSGSRVIQKCTIGAWDPTITIRQLSASIMGPDVQMLRAEASASVDGVEASVWTAISMWQCGTLWRVVGYNIVVTLFLIQSVQTSSVACLPHKLMLKHLFIHYKLSTNYSAQYVL